MVRLKGNSCQLSWPKNAAPFRVHDRQRDARGRIAVGHELAAIAAQDIRTIVVDAHRFDQGEVIAGDAGQVFADGAELGVHRETASREVVEIDSPVRAGHRIDAEQVEDVPGAEELETERPAIAGADAFQRPERVAGITLHVGQPKDRHSF